MAVETVIKFVDRILGGDKFKKRASLSSAEKANRRDLYNYHRDVLEEIAEINFLKLKEEASIYDVEIDYKKRDCLALEIRKFLPTDVDNLEFKFRTLLQAIANINNKKNLSWLEKQYLQENQAIMNDVIKEMTDGPSKELKRRDLIEYAHDIKLIIGNYAKANKEQAVFSSRG